MHDECEIIKRIALRTLRAGHDHLIMSIWIDLMRDLINLWNVRVHAHVIMIACSGIHESKCKELRELSDHSLQRESITLTAEGSNCAHVAW